MEKKHIGKGYWSDWSLQLEIEYPGQVSLQRWYGDKFEVDEEGSREELHRLIIKDSKYKGLRCVAGK